MLIAPLYHQLVGSLPLQLHSISVTTTTVADGRCLGLALAGPAPADIFLTARA